MRNEIPVADGVLIVESDYDADYPGMFVSFRPKGSIHEYQVVNIENVPSNSATSETPAKTVIVRVWGDTNNDDYTSRVDIPVADFQ